MANELNIALSTGLTVTAQRYQAGAAVGSAISCPEVGTSGFYSGNMTGASGTYQLVFLSGGATVGTGQINWSGTAEIPFSTLTTADIPSAAISAIQAKTDNLPSDPADQSLLEAAISALSIPSAASVATAVWSASTKEITGGTVDTLTNAPASVTPSDIWSHASRTITGASGPTAVEIRQEIDANSTKLDVAVGTRLAGSAYTAPANSDVAAIKAKTDAINTTRLGQVTTTEILGNLLAQANS